MEKILKWLISSKGLSWTTFIVVVAQGFHYYNLFYGLDVFVGLTNYIYSIFLTIVLSLPLMVFTVKLGTLKISFKDKDTANKDSERIDTYKNAIQWYTIIDIIINIYTWYTKLNVFYDWQWQLLPKYIVVTTIAILIPVTLKKFAGEIK